MTYRFYLTVTPFHATVACDSRSLPSTRYPLSFCLSFIFTYLQIPWRATPLFSHPYKTPGSVPSVGLSAPTSVPSVLRFFFNSFALKRLQPLSISSPSFLHPFPLFSTIYSFFFKIPGVWVSRTVLRGGGRRNSALLTTHSPLSSAYPTACMEETSSGISMRILDNSVRGSSSGGSFS